MSRPKVWARWESKTSDGTYVKFRIQEATEDQRREIYDFLDEFMLVEEKFHKASGIFMNREAREEYRQVIAKIPDDGKKHVVICCLDEDSDSHEPILGVSSMGVEMANDKPRFQDVQSTIKTPEIKKFIEILSFTKTMCDPQRRLGVKKFYGGRGIIVRPDYRGFGIGSQFLRTRRLISKAHGATATGAWMTSVATQKAAEKEGWSTVCEISFEELGNHLGVIFDTLSPPTCKLMVVKV